MEDLMKPRYKVILDYPLSHMYFDIGDILTFDNAHGERIIGGKDASLHPETVKKYPHIFQPLPWYAERKVEEMPLYLKKGNKVIQVSYEYFDNQLMVRNVINENLMPLGAIGDLVPTTKEEHEQYIKNLK